MKITLTNFGTWRKKTFEFNDEGLTLLSGPSGKGKTTIIRAINYALTGEGVKLPTHGEVKCMVEFEYKGLKITRTNRPGRLVVVDSDKRQYEDDEAQSVIYRIIGKHFSIAGYIQQKGENSFLSMSPAEKLKFLEKVVFSDVPIDDIKEKAKAMVTELELSVSRCQGKVDILQQTPVKPPPKPNTTFTEAQLRSQLATTVNNVKLLDARCDQLRKEISTQQITEEKRNSLKLRLGDIRIPTLPEKIDYKQDQLLLQQWTKYEAYVQACIQRDQINETHLKPHEKDVDQLADQLGMMKITEFTDEEKAELAELSTAVADYRLQAQHEQIRASYNQDKHQQLQRDVPLLRTELTTYALGKDARACPHCKASLRFSGSNLELYNGSQYSADRELDMKGRLKTMEKELKELDDKKALIDTFPTELIEMDVEEVNMRITELQQLQRKHLEEKEAKTVLERKYNSTKDVQTIQRLKKQHADLVLATSVTVEPPSIAKEELIRRTESGKKQDQEIEKIRKQIDELEKRRISIQKELENLPPSMDIEGLKSELTTSESLLSAERNQSAEHEKMVFEFGVYNREKDQFDKYTSSLQTSVDQLTQFKSRYTTAKKFRDAVITAEMLAIQSLIEEINTHLNQYLVLFFPDNPITIDVRLFKANEKTKIVRNQVNIQVGYHGAITDLSTLSGGEKDRVNLAFTLALAEIFNLPLLILDETLSTLDQQATENVLEHIQKDTRSIIVIAHQATSGLFDHNVKLE